MKRIFIGLLIGLTISAATAAPLSDADQKIAGLIRIVQSMQKRSFADGRRLDELERKVSGMQKQITLLHASKGDTSFQKFDGGDGQ